MPFEERRSCDTGQKRYHRRAANENCPCHSKGWEISNHLDGG